MFNFSILSKAGADTLDRSQGIVGKPLLGLKCLKAVKV